MKRLRYKVFDIDKVDSRILTLLADNARMSIADLSRSVEMSAPSVSERLKRLEENGVIQRYTIEIDPTILGYPLSFAIRIRPLAGKLRQVRDLLNQIPEIVACDRITGEDCFIARALVQSPEHLEQVIDQINPHARTNSSLIQSSPVPNRLPPLM